LIVNTCAGHVYPALNTAARHRSFACANAASGNPTIVVRGNPDPDHASTVTTVASTPTNATDDARAIPHTELTTTPPIRPPDRKTQTKKRSH
jgi:hypothetical protein